MCETKRTRIFSLLFLILTCMAEVLVAYCYDRGVRTITNYAGIAVFAFAGMTLFSGRYRRQIDLWVGVAFCGWFVISRILLGETYLEYSYGMLVNLCCAYLLCFPFARSMRDGQKKTGLRAGALVFGIGYTVLAFLAVGAAVIGKFITLPVLGTGLGIKGVRLEAGAHPNITAFLFFVAFVLIVWMVAEKYRRWTIPAAAVSLLVLYAGIALTDSRTVMLQMACFAAGLAFLGAQRLPLAIRWKKIGLGVLAALVCLVLVLSSFSWVVSGVTLLSNSITAHAEEASVSLVQNRSLLDRIDSFGGRMPHYLGIVELLKENPSVLLTGILNSKLVRVLLEYAEGEHAHNSYLQTLVNVGIPGLLMALFFTVRAVWVSLKLIFHKRAAFADQILAVILLSFLVLTIPESYLFTEYLTAANMPFFLVFGYALEAERHLRGKGEKA